jgi:hypothetical protein
LSAWGSSSREPNRTGAEPCRARRFDPINLMVFDTGEIAHASFITLTAPQGTVELLR